MLIDVNGEEIEFPDSMSDEEIKAILRQKTSSAPQAVGEVVRSVASGAGRSIMGGYAGALEGAMNGVDAGAETVRDWQEGAYTPETELGKEYLGNVSKGLQWVIDKFNVPVSGWAAIAELVAGEGLDQAVRTIESVQSRGAGETFGDRTLEETGSPELATLSRVAPEALVEALGLKGGGTAVRSGAAATRRAATQTGEVVRKSAAEAAIEAKKVFEETKKAAQRSKDEGIFQKSTEEKQEIANLMEAADKNPELIDARTAEFDVAPPKKSEPAGGIEVTNESYKAGAKDVKRDKFAVESIRQGWDDGVVAVVRGSSDSTKNVMKSMLSLRKDLLTKPLLTKRPSDFVGDILAKRYNTVVKQRESLAKKLNGFARNNLRGRVVDYRPAIAEFLEDMKAQGVRFGGDEPSFDMADFAAIPDATSTIKTVLKRLDNSGSLDAAGVHMLKQFLDTTIDATYKSPLSNKAKNAISRLRRRLNNVLRDDFPEYKAINDELSTVLDVLGEFKKVGGKDLDDLDEIFQARKLGASAMRRITSNAVSNAGFAQAISKLDKLAAKYEGRTPDSDLMALHLFGIELDEMFGASAKTSLQGVIESGVKQTQRAMTGDRMGVAGDLLASQVGKIMGVSQEQAFQSMVRLLNQKKQPKPSAKEQPIPNRDRTDNAAQ